MSLVSAVVAARKAMEPLVVDKKAKAGAYSFKYASLIALLDVVMPALAEQGVMLFQDVSGTPKSVSVRTILKGGDDESISSELLTLEHNGTAQEMGKACTTLKRYQLSSFLGLAAEDDDAAAPESTPIRGQGQHPQNVQGGSPGASQPERGTQGAAQGRSAQAGPAPLGPAASSGTGSSASSGASLDLLRMAARKGQGGGQGGSPELQTLLLRLRGEDAKDGPEMATLPAEGKKVSIYRYMADTVIGNVVEKANAEQVLSYMYGRVINQEFPPKENTRFLFDEVMAGSHKKVLGEARQKLLA